MDVIWFVNEGDVICRQLTQKQIRCNLAKMKRLVEKCEQQMRHVKMMNNLRRKHRPSPRLVCLKSTKINIELKKKKL